MQILKTLKMLGIFQSKFVYSWMVHCPWLCLRNKLMLILQKYWEI